MAALSNQASPATNSVFVTRNLIFYLSSATHGGYPAAQFKSDEMIERAFIGTDTNYTYYRILPFDQSFDFKLTDEKGQMVQKTEKGSAMGKPSVPPKSRGEINKFKGEVVRQDMAEDRLFFRPDEMFVITNKGIYDLEVRIRVCVPTTNDVPDFAAMTNGYSFFGSKSFGVLTSPPLRVKVIKE
jgi:hypothetical protein